MKKSLLLFILFGLILIVPLEVESVFAEKTISVQKTVNVDKTSLMNSISSLDRYSQILPKYIQSSQMIEENTVNMKIGLDWISIDTDVKFLEYSDHVTLEVISGDFKGTTLYVTMTEKTNNSSPNTQTDISAELSLKQSWHMGIITSFVTDDDIESMLNTSLNGLVEYAKNPTPLTILAEEKEKFCIFSLCF